MPATDSAIPRRFCHGTGADLKPGDLIAAGYDQSVDKSPAAPRP